MTVISSMHAECQVKFSKSAVKLIHLNWISEENDGTDMAYFDSPDQSLMESVQKLVSPLNSIICQWSWIEFLSFACLACNQWLT